MWPNRVQVVLSILQLNTTAIKTLDRAHAVNFASVIWICQGLFAFWASKQWLYHDITGKTQIQNTWKNFSAIIMRHHFNMPQHRERTIWYLGDHPSNCRMGRGVKNGLNKDNAIFTLQCTVAPSSSLYEISFIQKFYSVPITYLLH